MVHVLRFIATLRSQGMIGRTGRTLLQSHWLRSGIAGLLLLTLLSVMVRPAHAAGPTYYVDCSASSNGDGSQGNPWNTLNSVNATNFQPGNTILFHSGTTCSGQLHPGGSGNSSATISIGTDGSGSARIDGNGTVDTVYLYNQQYWDISNLEITNTGSSAAEVAGVRIVAQDSGTISHIHLSHLYVHNVSGVLQNGQYNDYTTGSIVIQVTGSTTQTHFDDVLITGCTIQHTDRVGIVAVWSTWGNRGGITYQSGPWVPSTNVNIQNNTITDTGADAILVYADTGPNVQNNTVSNAAARNGNGVVAVWSTDVDNPIFQGNQVSGTGASNDGEAFDCDYETYGCTVQNNTTHDNYGGFVTFYGAANTVSITGNVSTNDGSGNGNLIRNAFQIQAGQISGNTFYLRSGANVADGPFSSNVSYTGNTVVPAATLSGDLALNRSYSSSSNYGGSQTASEAFDGNYSTDWQAANGHFAGEWLAVDFGSNTTFNEVKLTEYGNRTQGFLIQYWDGSNWQTAYTGTTIGATSVTTTFTFPAVTGSRARLYLTAGGPYQPIIYEFEIYNVSTTLVQNGGFENGLANWQNWGGNSTTTSDAHSGATALLETGNASLGQGISGYTPGASYTLSAWAKLSTSYQGSVIGVFWYVNGQQFSASFAVTSTSYSQGQTTFTLPSNASSLQVWVYNAAGGNLTADDITLSPS